MIGRTGGWEVHVVVHLDVEGDFKRVGKRCMRVVEITEVRTVNWGAGK